MEKPSEKTYTINGQHKALTDDEFDKFCQDLVDKGYYVKSIVWQFRDAFSPPIFTEIHTMVGNKVKWGETP